MPKYLFFPPANDAQDKIWNYTYKEWGEKQAVKYITGLHDHLSKLANKQKIWMELPNSLIVPPDLNLEVYFSRYEHHQIFFRKLSKGNIGIISILHESSDMPVRLVKDLRKIENNE